MVAGAALVVVAAAVGLATWDRGGGGTIAWVARHELAPAAPVTQADFDRVAVSLPDPGVLYPAATPPVGTAGRPIAAGEPLLAADVRPEAAADSVAVTLSLAPERLPAGLAPGAQVDVWTGPAPRLVLSGVTVSHVASGSDLAGTAQVEVLVPTQTGEHAVAAALADEVVVVRRP